MKQPISPNSTELELRVSTSNSARRDQLDSLEAQTRSWLGALGYDVEPAGDEPAPNSLDYSAWFVSRDKPTERCLVHVIAGPAELGHVLRLRDQLDEHRDVASAWLISQRRASRLAAAYMAQTAQTLACYSFDELLERDSDFSAYFLWLEGELSRRHIKSNYIPQAGAKDEFDLLDGSRLGESPIAELEGWIDGYIDRWLSDPSTRNIFLSGEFGTGKTWFAMYYAAKQMNHYRLARSHGDERPRLLCAGAGDRERGRSHNRLVGCAADTSLERTGAGDRRRRQDGPCRRDRTARRLTRIAGCGQRYCRGAGDELNLQLRLDARGRLPKSPPRPPPSHHHRGNSCVSPPPSRPSRSS